MFDVADLAGGTTCNMRTILITGCSSGIGLEAARSLKRRGWQVFATCRSERDCHARREEGLESFTLDYADQESIDTAMMEALSRCDGDLDAVFNNGAFALPGAVEDLSREALDAIFQVNLYGPHEVARHAVRAMRARGRGRIVNCSSAAGFTALPFGGAYTATKHAMEGLTDSMRIELRKTAIKVSLIEPGPIRGTSIYVKGRAQHERWIDSGRSVWREHYEEQMKPRLSSSDPARDPFERGMRAVMSQLIHALESPRPRARYFVTGTARLAWWFRFLLPTAVNDAMAARQFGPR